MSCEVVKQPKTNKETKRFKKPKLKGVLRSVSNSIILLVKSNIQSMIGLQLLLSSVMTDVISSTVDFYGTPPKLAGNSIPLQGHREEVRSV